jgi:hypothetical protein
VLNFAARRSGDLLSMNERVHAVTHHARKITIRMAPHRTVNEKASDFLDQSAESFARSGVSSSGIALFLKE